MCQGNTLPAILGARNLCNCLCCNITCSRKALWRLNHSLTDNRSVLQHILQIHKTAIMHMLCKIISIMKMNNPFFMRFHNIRSQKKTLRNILADLSCHVISLNTVYCRIFIGIFLFYFLIIAL